jgi:glycosyltransferase involved in cell wall biosynthesis
MPSVYLRYRRAQLSAVAAHSVWVLPICWALAKAANARLIYNPHELETETPTMTGVKKGVAQVIEQMAVSRCDLVTVVNESIADWYASRYRMTRPIVAYNMPTSRPVAADIRGKLGIASTDILFIHTGRLAEGRNITEILRVFEAEQSCPSKHVLFLGDGPYKASIIAAATRCPRIHWLAPVQSDTVVSYVREADVALCLIDVSSISYRLSSPNKLFEALAAGVPPLCTQLVEAERALGSLFARWQIQDVAQELAPRVRDLTSSDFKEFQRYWQGLRSWDEEVRDLLSAYASLLSPESAC